MLKSLISGIVETYTNIKYLLYLSCIAILSFVILFIIYKYCGIYSSIVLFIVICVIMLIRPEE